MEKGANAISDSELLAILLRTGMQGRSALEIANSLLNQFQSLNRLSTAALEELQSVRGVGRDKAVTLSAAFELAGRMAKELHRDSPVLDSPDRIADLLREENRRYRVEQFQVVLLSTRRTLIAVEKISSGTLDTLLVHPREVFKTAVVSNASAIVLAHNHPSGDPSPSEADLKVTRDLIRAGQILKIDVLDHIILGRRSTERTQDFVSLRELGYFYS